MEGSDVCFAPVLAMDEAPSYPHNAARERLRRDRRRRAAGACAAVSDDAGRCKARRRRSARTISRLSRDWGFAESRVDALRGAGVI